MCAIILGLTSRGRRVLAALSLWLENGHVTPDLIAASHVLSHAFALLGGLLSPSHPLTQQPDCLPTLLEVTSNASTVLTAGSDAHVTHLHLLLAPIPSAPAPASAPGLPARLRTPPC